MHSMIVVLIVKRQETIVPWYPVGVPTVFIFIALKNGSINLTWSRINYVHCVDKNGLYYLDTQKE